MTDPGNSGDTIRITQKCHTSQSALALLLLKPLRSHADCETVRRTNGLRGSCGSGLCQPWFHDGRSRPGDERRRRNGSISEEARLLSLSGYPAPITTSTGGKACSPTAYFHDAVRATHGTAGTPRWNARTGAPRRRFAQGILSTPPIPTGRPLRPREKAFRAPGENRRGGGGEGGPVAPRPPRRACLRPQQGARTLPEAPLPLAAPDIRVVRGHRCERMLRGRAW